MSRILIVDDDPAMRDVTRIMLEKAGHQVLEAKTGVEGLKMLSSEKPDLVLLDIMMPGEDGWAVCNEMKAKTKTIPVVIFTVRGSAEDIEKSRESGSDAHISKPFDMEDLLSTVKRLTEKT